jgi:alpha-tubulin suppressor-like RCC1 family protein
MLLGALIIILAGCPSPAGSPTGADGDPTDVVQVLAGYEWSLVLRSDGTVWGWGGQHDSDGTVRPSFGVFTANPVQMYPSVLVNVKQIAGAYDGWYALLQNGRVLHWGNARYASDGRGTDGFGGTGGALPQFRFNASPVEVLTDVGAPVDRVCAINASIGRLFMIRGVDAAGVPTSCAPGANRTVWIAGSFNNNGTNYTILASPLPGLPAFGNPDYSPLSAVFAGNSSSGTPPALIVLEDGRGFGLGENAYNGFGFPVGAVPPYLGGSSGAVQVPASWGAIRSAAFTFYYSMLALRSDGTGAASGYNSNGDLGIGNSTTATFNGPLPVLSDNMTGFSTTGTGVSLALRNGEILVWGKSVSQGLMGPSITESNVPVSPFALSGFTQVSGGNSHALALGPGGTVYSWGHCLRGALGDGVGGSIRYTPAPVPLP